MRFGEGAEAYRILGLDEDAGTEDLKAAFRFLSKKYHPDRTGDPSTGARFAKVARAYRILRPRLEKEALVAATVRPSLVRDDGGDLFSLGAAATTAADPVARRRAVRLLGFSGKKAAWVFLRGALSDREPTVAAAALRAIADLSLFQASGEVAAIYARGNGGIRDLIMDVAEETGEALFAKALDVAEGDEDLPRRSRAISIRRNLARGSA